MTQLELAERLNVSMSYISKVERSRLQSSDYPSEKSSLISPLSCELMRTSFYCLPIKSQHQFENAFINALHCSKK